MFVQLEAVLVVGLAFRIIIKGPDAATLMNEMTDRPAGRPRNFFTRHLSRIFLHVSWSRRPEKSPVALSIGIPGYDCPRETPDRGLVPTEYRSVSSRLSSVGGTHEYIIDVRENVVRRYFCQVLVDLSDDFLKHLRLQGAP